MRPRSISRVALCAAAALVAAVVTEVGASAPPEWPRVLLDTTYLPPTTGTLITVAAGGDFQAALDAARPGDVIELQAGATFTGNFVLPDKSGSGWIHIRSSALASLPGPGARVDPSHAVLMPKIVTPNTAPAVATAAAAHHYRFIGIEITGTHATTGSTLFNVVWLDGGPPQDATAVRGQTSLSQVPFDIIFDRCYVHGTPTGNIRRGFALNSARTAIIGSYLSNFHEVGADSQAIACWTGPGPFKIVNNYLEGAGENLIFGGAVATLPNLVPEDIEIRGNHFFKPLSWRIGHPSYAGTPWTVKNLFELKNARRVLAEGNLLEQNWAHAQNGFAILFTVRNDDCQAPWGTVEDVTFRKNILRHAGGGFNIHGTDNNCPSQQTRRILIQDNLLTDISSAGWGGTGRLFQYVSYPSINTGIADLTIEHNTGFPDVANGVAGFNLSRLHTGFAFRNNIAPKRTYGFAGASTLNALLDSPDMPDGDQTLGTFFAAPVVTGNILTGGAPASYSGYPGNFFPASDAQVGFVDPAGGNYRLAPSSPFKSSGTDGRDPGADIDALEAAMCPPGDPLPGDVANLRIMEDRRIVQWDPEPGSDRYDVLRGGLSDLRAHRDFRDAFCVADDVAVASLEDPSIPSLPGDGIYYVVRGMAGTAAECRRGTYGTTLRDITGLACP
jgi:hypothetical protein